MIRFHCDCGRTITAKPSLAGKRVKCPACDQPVVVPSGANVEEEEEGQEGSGDESQQPQIDGRTIALISYITLPGWIVAFILFKNCEEDRSLAAFHLRQTLGLNGIGILLPVLASVLFASVPAARGVGGGVLSLVSLVMLVYWIYGIVSAARGEQECLIASLGDFLDGLFLWID